MQQSEKLFSFIVDMWRSRNPSTQEEMMRVADELRTIDVGFNMQAMDLSPNDPFDFRLQILKKPAGVRNPFGVTGPLISTLGAYPDPQFYQREVVPRYAAARDTGLIQISTTSGRVLDRITAYDRLILPVKPRFRNVRHALAIINIKGSFPAGARGTQQLSIEEREVLFLLANGIATDEISIRRGCSKHRLEQIIDAVLTKLKAKNLIHAIAIAVARDLVDAMETNHGEHLAKLRLEFSGSFFSELREGVVFVDANARVVYANETAEAVIAEGDLRLRNGVLWAGGPQDTISLHRLVARCGKGETTSSPGYLTVSRGWDRMALSLLVKPAPAAMINANEPLIMISIVDPYRIALPGPGQLQQQFGFTRTEAIVALEIVMGTGVQAAAERLGIGIGTVKTHLVRVFAKTNTNRQAELARLLLAMRHLTA